MGICRLDLYQVKLVLLHASKNACMKAQQSDVLVDTETPTVSDLLGVSLWQAGFIGKGNTRL